MKNEFILLLVTQHTKSWRFSVYKHLDAGFLQNFGDVFVEKGLIQNFVDVLDVFLSFSRLIHSSQAEKRLWHGAAVTRRCVSVYLTPDALAKDVFLSCARQQHVRDDELVSRARRFQALLYHP